jgi:hypothetical protein
MSMVELIEANDEEVERTEREVMIVISGDLGMMEGMKSCAGRGAVRIVGGDFGR